MAGLVGTGPSGGVLWERVAREGCDTTSKAIVCGREGLLFAA